MINFLSLSSDSSILTSDNDIAGKWSDGDKSWELVSDDVKSEMGLHYMHDGEFWIEFFSDFCREFEEVSSPRGTLHLYN